MLKALPEIRPAGIKQIDRTKELAWLKSNRQNYVGQWVALFGGNLVVAGDDARTVLENARAKGIERLLLVHVQADEPFSGGWM